MEGYVDQISIMLEIRDSEELSTMKLLASEVKKCYAESKFTN